MDQHVTSLIGIMLQDFEPLPSRYSLEESIRRHMTMSNVSIGAKQLLERALQAAVQQDVARGDLPLVSEEDEGRDHITSLWVMHEPVDDEVLGFTFDHNYGCIKLSAHKAEPREGWYCKTVGFIFGSL